MELISHLLQLTLETKNTINHEHHSGHTYSYCISHLTILIIKQKNAPTLHCVQYILDSVLYRR